MSILISYEEISSKTGASIPDVIVLGGNVGIGKLQGYLQTLLQLEEAQHRSKLTLNHLKSLNQSRTGFVII